MKQTLIRQLADAGRLTRDGRLADATRAIREVLAAARPSHATTDAGGTVIDVEARVVDKPAASPGTAGAPSGFLSGRFRNTAGEREYRLFVPPGGASARRGLVVMLHGCTQNPLDFATGTRMNLRAGAQGLCVLYPAQAQSANHHGCWNWFRSADQQRGRGEPAILAGMTRQVVADGGLDPRRVFVAGLSAGGAMAVTLGAAYPELFAAIGVHSGLPHGAASDLPSALAAMRQGAAPGDARVNAQALPTIVFHGDADTTVHPCNGEQVLRQVLRVTGGAAGAPPRIEHGQVPGGHAYTRAVHLGAGGRVEAEHWIIHGGGHAWSGGDPQGSHTDGRGPDASAQMLRFFLEHPRRD